MKNNLSVAVTSRSFSQNLILRKAILERYQNVRFNEMGKVLTESELIEFMQNQQLAIVGLEKFTAKVLAQLPELKVISRFGVGVDTLDVAELKRRGIRLSVAQGANKRSVAELVIAFAISLLRTLPAANQTLREGKWQQFRGRQLTGKTVGIIGFGSIGKELAKLLESFECSILTFDLCDQERVLNTLLQNADVVSVHLPLNEGTRCFLNAERLAMMKPSAVLINTSRGGIVDEDIVKYMLKSKLLHGAAFDVFQHEPPSDQELLSLPNFFSTPHIAGTTEEAIIAMGFAAIEGLL